MRTPVRFGVTDGAIDVTSAAAGKRKWTSRVSLRPALLSALHNSRPGTKAPGRARPHERCLRPQELDRGRSRLWCRAGGQSNRFSLEAGTRRASNDLLPMTSSFRA